MLDHVREIGDPQLRVALHTPKGKTYWTIRIKNRSVKIIYVHLISNPSLIIGNILPALPRKSPKLLTTPALFMKLTCFVANHPHKNRAQCVNSSPESNPDDFIMLKKIFPQIRYSYHLIYCSFEGQNCNLTAKGNTGNIISVGCVSGKYLPSKQITPKYSSNDMAVSKVRQSVS